MASIENRVARIAEALLAERQFFTPIDVLVGLGWLAQSNVDRWTKRHGRGTVEAEPISLHMRVDDQLLKRVTREIKAAAR